MATLLPEDFREFLKLCNRKKLKYLLIGGYAVNAYGYHRSTADMDIWIELSEKNARRMVQVLIEFGFEVPELSADLFLELGKMIRMGVPPMRLEIHNEISGVSFAACYRNRIRKRIDGINVDLISLDDLKTNKKASARLKDLNDVENLPEKGE